MTEMPKGVPDLSLGAWGPVEGEEEGKDIRRVPWGEVAGVVE